MTKHRTAAEQRTYEHRMQQLREAFRQQAEQSTEKQPGLGDNDESRLTASDLEVLEQIFQNPTPPKRS